MVVARLRRAISESLEEMVDEHRDVLGTLPQRRNGEVNDVDSVEKVRSQVTFPDQLRRIAVGGREDAHVVGPDDAFRAHALNFTGFEEPQQPALDMGRQLPDFVEKQCAVLRHFEPSCDLRRRAAGMAEEFDLEQRLGDTRAVHRHERS